MANGELLALVRRCFARDAVFYSKHARLEMTLEEFGPIREHEVFEAVSGGEEIEEYPEDRPYPSVLVLGRTLAGRPLHVVCAYDSADDLAIVVTAYQPNPSMWINFRERRQR